MPSNACFANVNSIGVPRLRRVLRALAWLYPEIGYCQGTGMVSSLGGNQGLFQASCGPCSPLRVLYGWEVGIDLGVPKEGRGNMCLFLGALSVSLKKCAFRRVPKSLS